MIFSLFDRSKGIILHNYTFFRVFGREGMGEKVGRGKRGELFGGKMEICDMVERMQAKKKKGHISAPSITEVYFNWYQPTKRKINPIQRTNGRI